jgi:hypothetical protein
MKGASFLLFRVIGIPIICLMSEATFGPAHSSLMQVAGSNSTLSNGFDGTAPWANVNINRNLSEEILLKILSSAADACSSSCL